MPTIPATHTNDRFERNPFDIFETQQELANAVMNCCLNLCRPWYEDKHTFRILDPGCGNGVWTKAARKVYIRDNAKFYGVDLNVEDTLNPLYHTYMQMDYLKLRTDLKFNLIVGNPPYSAEGNNHLAEDFILKSLDLLDAGGVLMFMLKTEFTSSVRRMKNIYSTYAPLKIIQLVPRPQFNGMQNSNTIEYSIFMWRKAHTAHPLHYWFNWKTGELV